MDNDNKRNIAWLFSSNVVQITIGFAINLALVRLISPVEFGQFAIISANVSLICMVVNFRLGDVIIRTPTDDLTPELLGSLASAALIQSVVAGTLSVIALVATSNLSLPSVVLMLSFILGNWVSMQVQIQIKRFHHKNVAIMESVSHAGSHVMTLVIAVAGFPASALFFQNATRLLINIAMLHRNKAWTAARPRALSKADVSALNFRLRGLWVDGLLEQAMERVILLFVGAAAGTSGAGYFYQARRLALIPGQLFDPIASRFAYAYFANRVAESERLTVLRRSFALAFVALLTTVAAVFAFAPTLVPLVYGRTWQPAVPILFGLSGMVVGATLMGLLKSHFYATFQISQLITLGRVPFALTFLVAAMSLMATGQANAFALSVAVSGAYCISILLLATRSLSRR